MLWGFIEGCSSMAHCSLNVYTILIFSLSIADIDELIKRTVFLKRKVGMIYIVLERSWYPEEVFISSGVLVFENNAQYTGLGNEQC